MLEPVHWKTRGMDDQMEDQVRPGESVNQDIITDTLERAETPDLADPQFPSSPEPELEDPGLAEVDVTGIPGGLSDSTTVLEVSNAPSSPSTEVHESSHESSELPVADTTSGIEQGECIPTCANAINVLDLL